MPATACSGRRTDESAGREYNSGAFCYAAWGGFRQGAVIKSLSPHRFLLIAFCSSLSAHRFRQAPQGAPPETDIAAIRRFAQVQNSHRKTHHACCRQRAHATEKGMAGHSKWANIKHKKAAADAKRGKVWTRLIKEIQVAARMGGGEIDSNPRLRLAVEKAYDANMPKDNINRAIQRGVGGVDGANYEEIRYEGYGIGGAAVIVDTMTDNRTRTVAEVRHAFSKFGGNMGTDGSVSFLFDHVGQFLFAPGTPEDKLMDAALEAGANDVVTNDDGSIEVLAPPNDFSKVKAALEAAGFKAELAEVTMKPQTEVEFTGEDALKMQKLLDALENLDDVQEVYTNASIVEE
jgi:YebC/PmpR family DNA-binding regulatory protein